VAGVKKTGAQHQEIPSVGFPSQTECSFCSIIQPKVSKYQRGEDDHADDQDIQPLASSDDAGLG
jgi:hypothetical protein